MGETDIQQLVPQATPVLCKILTPIEGRLDEPIRSEIFGLQRFSQHGHSLGLTHRAVTHARSSVTFTPRLRSNISRLRAAYEYIGAQANAGYDISPAAEWLIENFHLLEAQFKEVSDGLPRSYFRTLPVLVEPPLKGLPRIYGVAWAFVAHTDGAFDEELLENFLSAYQDNCELHLSELWALPTTLRVVLMENMRRLSERVAANKAARELANKVCDHLDRFSIQTLNRLVSILRQRGFDKVFLAHMAHRMQGFTKPHRAYQEWFNEVLPDLAGLQAQLRADQAADNLSVSNAVSSLRAIGDADWPEIVARTSVLIGLLLTSSLFASEHTTTRDATLHGIEQMARRLKCSERDVAQGLLDLIHASNPEVPELLIPSYWLEGQGFEQLQASLRRKSPHWTERLSKAWGSLRPAHLWMYLITAAVCTLAATAWLLRDALGVQTGPPTPLWLLGLAALLMLFPVSEAVLALMQRLISESYQPRPLHRLAFSQGITHEHRTIVVIPCMLSDQATTLELVHRLHLHFLANPEDEAQFALLTDWTDSPTETKPDDASLLDHARHHIGALNKKHPRPHGESTKPVPRFLLLHRPREFSPTEQIWIGRERKRGKLEQLISTLALNQGGSFLVLGEESDLLADIQYVVTLDSDTQLPPGKLRALVGIAAHPFNKPKLDPQGRRVLSGYGILQPRVVTPLPEPHSVTLFHWLFSGQIGMDPYSAACSEIYQDVFAEGTFCGKGLIHVGVAHQVLSARIPEGQVLSHDLLEGALARCASVTDITLVEESPSHADVAASRAHRWMRGDWQLLPLLLNAKANGINGLNQWKMVDNLRRSLLAPACLALLVMALSGWVISPGTAFLLLLAAWSTGTWAGALAGLIPSRGHLSLRHFYAQSFVELQRALLASIWSLALLAQHSVSSVDAISRALLRTFFSRRHLLQWTTSAAAHGAAKTGLWPLIWEHRKQAFLTISLASVLVWVGAHIEASIALCLLWGASPVWIWLSSRVSDASAREAIGEEDAFYLQGIARDTWRFFERSVTEKDRHLPPDNLQVMPYDMLAHRTSPTNIGLYLLSVACAREFGWISTQDLINRLNATMASLTTLNTYRGHFYNWYDTQTGAPLLPMYVSTVDSGNLSGHLLSVSEACRQLAASGNPRQDSATASAVGLAMARKRLMPLLLKRRSLQKEDRDALRWMLKDHHNTRQSADLEVTGDQSQQLLALAEQCEALAWQPDFKFLYHSKRRLLHIGFRVQEHELDASFYDLLASESRLASMLAIAKGDVPVVHWSALGRMFYALGATAGLRSWSGSMFEYLMPSLILKEPESSVLQGAAWVAVLEQRNYTKTLGVPWGISESAYSGIDHTLAYQYAPQGVPRLALRRTPADELVIAPYATALALLQVPQDACNNFHALQALGARLRYGFIEALDYTASRQTEARPFTAVRTFMAHHQGMTIASLAHVLCDGAVRRWGMGNDRVEAFSSLLHERAPKEIPRLYRFPQGVPTQMLRRRSPGLLRDIRPGTLGIEPTHLLSNGHYHVALRANGAGTIRCGQTMVARSRDDALRDSFGNFFYISSPSTGDGNALVSLTQHPAPDPLATYQCTFHADRVTYKANWDVLQAQTVVWVSPEDDIELRQIELQNLGDTAMELELVSFFEVALTDERADEAHPAFAKFFVRAHWEPSHQALVFERKPRIQSEPSAYAAHFLAQADAEVLDVQICADRQKWLGRNSDIRCPLRNPGALQPAESSGPAAIEVTTGLDPVAVLVVKIRLNPNSIAKLTFATAASENAQTLHAVMDKYRQASHIQRSSLMSATLAGIRLRAFNIGSENFSSIQTLTTGLLSSLCASSQALVPGQINLLTVCDRRLLWRFGISGDKPILLVSVGVMQGLGLLRSLAQALRLWSWSGVACDLVIVNTEPNSYLMGLQREITALQQKVTQDCAATPILVRMHLFRSEELSEDELSTFQCLARLQIQADGRPLAYSVEAWAAQHQHAANIRKSIVRQQVSAAPMVQDRGTSKGVHLDNGEFQFDVMRQLRPQRPWSNVLANPKFGSLITEAGGGYTWAVNSRLNQLTAWSNDPVADPPSEWLLLQNLQTREVWSLCPSAWGEADARYRITHGQGFTTMVHQHDALDIEAKWWVHAEDLVKTIEVRIRNTGDMAVNLRLISLYEWIMGSSRSDRRTTSTWKHASGTAGHQQTILGCMQEARESGFGGGTAFMSHVQSVSAYQVQWTCDRREFFDAQGRLVIPETLGQTSGQGLDPCAALIATFQIAAGKENFLSFDVGYASTADDALALAIRASKTANSVTRLKVENQWASLTGAVKIRTPDPLFDAMVNHWLIYQTVSCRLWAKAGFYQAGGATGFRDQLQDTMALVWAAPKMLRSQILLCASRQFVAGDVQHWWHDPAGVGVRTHFSDDLLWLPYATLHYLKATDDQALLDETVAFLNGAEIPAGSEDAYYAPTQAQEEASLYEHAALTLDRSMAVGVHGLPLMGSGDWNDGMNQVGVGGRGESVWLGWFLCGIVKGFAPLARDRHEAARASRWESAAQGWQTALLTEGWDGQWFKRAFFDNGQPMGSHTNEECQIDLIAQAWSVLSNAAPQSMQATALDSMHRMLVDPQQGLLLLLAPPFEFSDPSPGYIQTYPAGIRENGGQYAHAGVWALMAQTQAHRLGLPAPESAESDQQQTRGDLAYSYFTYLSSAHRAAHPVWGQRYGLEPYAIAGDVYSMEPYAGLGGWSWYTGAAGWLHQAAISAIFGLELKAHALSFNPCMPSCWNETSITLKRSDISLHFRIYRNKAKEPPIVLNAGELRLEVGEDLAWESLADNSRYAIALKEVCR